MMERTKKTSYKHYWSFKLEMINPFISSPISCDAQCISWILRTRTSVELVHLQQAHQNKNSLKPYNLLLF